MKDTNDITIQTHWDLWDVTDIQMHNVQTYFSDW